MLSKPDIIILVGLPGSGKSTWTNDFLKDHEDFVVCSSDDILEEYAKKDGINYNESFNKYIKTATREYLDKLQSSIDERKNIIIDRTNFKRASRVSIIEMCEDNYNIQAMVFNPVFEEVMKRLAKRKEETGKDIPLHVLHMMKHSFEYPQFDEGFVSIGEVE